MIAYHFLAADGRLRDGRDAPADGVKLVFPDAPILCERGLHASLDPFDALQYAPGPILCRVECDGHIIRGNDKLVCTERTILARADASERLRYFARMQALSVVDKWNAPGVVLDWLMTGDEALRDAASRAASRAASSAAWNAASNAAWNAASNAAWNAASRAAWSAAWSAASNAAWSAARAEFNQLVREGFGAELE